MKNKYLNSELKLFAGERTPNLKLEEELALGFLIKYGLDGVSTLAQEKLIKSYLGLLVCRTYYFLKSCPCVDFNEALSEAADAIFYASKKYDYTRGFKFSGLAYRVIDQRLSRLRSKEKTEYLRKKRLDKIDKKNLGSNIPQLLENQDHTKLIRDKLENLSLLEQHVIQQRFLAKEIKTLKQLGVEIGYTKERIRQIQNEALRKLSISFTPEQRQEIMDYLSA
ncbi:MAG: sigma-70 family RNA polymerase sigma factor [Candidatus Pacearchaeota archaeon]